jgi:hypothetical protein
MPEVDIFDFNPGDFRVDLETGVDSGAHGVYVYFDESNFEADKTDEESANHEPSINVDVYLSAKAFKNTTTGKITQSPKRCNDALKSLVSSLWDCLMHASFQRLLEEKIKAVSGVDIWNLTECRVVKSEFMGTLRLLPADKTVMMHRYTLLVNVTEIAATDDGIALAGRDDFVQVFRKEDDQGTLP